MKTKIYLVLIILLGFFLRGFFLLTPHVDSDQAVFGLMAMHIMKGEIPLIQWGFPYMASGESFFAVPFFWIFGPTPFSLNLSIAVQSIIFIVLIYFLGRRMGGSRIGLLAALYTAAGPIYLMEHCVLARGAYIETLILGTLSLWMAHRIFYPYKKGDRGWISYFVLGLVCGIGLWFHFLIIFFIAPTGLFFLLKPRTLFRKTFLWVVLGFFLGSAPFWVHNFDHHFESLVYLFRHEEKHHTLWQGFKFCFTTGLPIVVGILKNSDQTPYFKGVSLFLIPYFIFLIQFIYQSVSSFWGQKKMNGATFILAFFFLYLFIIDETQYLEMNTRRYFVPMFAALPLLWAFGINSFIKKSRVLGGILLGAFMVFHLYTLYLDADVFHPEYKTVYENEKKNERALFEYLEKKNLRHLYYQNYWLGFRLNFFSQEKIVFSQEQCERYTPYQKALEASDHPAWLERGNHGFDTLKVIGGSYEREDVNPFHIYYQFHEPPRAYCQIDPEGIIGQASCHSEDIEKVLDRSLGTAWTSGSPKTPGMWIQFDLGQIYKLGMLRLWNKGQYFHNIAREVSLETSLDGVHWTEVFPRTLTDFFYWSGPRLYYWEFNYRLEARWGPARARFLRLKQYENENLNSWMIHEAYFYEDVGERLSRDGQEDVLQAIHDLGLTKVYADRWMNAKIREATGGKVETIEPFIYPTSYAGFPDRRVRWGPKVGFVLEDSDANLFEGMMKEDGIGLVREAYGRWVLFYFESWGKSESMLDQHLSWWWIGFGVVRANTKLHSEYLKNLGIQEEKGERWEEALKFYQKALRFYPHYLEVHRRLIEMLKKLRRNDQAEKELKILLEQTQPQHLCPIQFEKGITFLGYRLNAEEVKSGARVKIFYFWKLERDVSRERPNVFVHVEGQGKLFQGDHTLLSWQDEVGPFLEDEALREEEELIIPADISPGEYRISLGLFNPHTGKRWKVQQTNLENKKNKVSIGTLKL
ncbi:MAG: discoidin domain-containing protein [Chlamydiae bacterium]|nr:discoidin domain-containing protein [Chlamydiota bacterium]MBI3276589.1 discoidin domain-containing protein [Chlamydiota bacterium]